MNRVLACGASALFVIMGGCDGASPSSAQAQGKAPPAAPSAGPQDDLFAFVAGARFVQKPADVEYGDMNYGPMTLIDESGLTDWTSIANVPAVFVLELAERTAISRLVFDTTGGPKTPKAIKVEVSDTSAAEGFQTVLATDLTLAGEQTFPLASKPVGRWVRLTVTSNHSGEYFGLVGFRGYGEQLTHAATVADVSGTYEGGNGWGEVHLKQEGTRVIGCYEYQSGLIAGGIEGRMLKAEMTEQGPDGAATRMFGLFAFPDGKSTFGLSRAADQTAANSQSAYYGAEKISDDIGDCPAIPNWRGQAAKSQLSAALESAGRARLDGVNFDFNAAVIQPASRPLLDQIVQLLKEKPDWQVALEGHTDNVGGAAFNKTLSAQRAAAVQAYLAAGGIAPGRLTSAGFGYERPAAANDTQAGRAQNRRVEIVRR